MFETLKSKTSFKASFGVQTLKETNWIRTLNMDAVCAVYSETAAIKFKLLTRYELTTEKNGKNFWTFIG